MSIKDKAKSILESKGFIVSTDNLRIRNLFGKEIQFERVVGIVEGKARISWRYNPRADKGEINIAIYNVHKEDVEDIVETLESKGLIVEVIDDNVYGKTRFKGKGLNELKDIATAIR